MKRITVLLVGVMGFIWTINAQDTTNLNLGASGTVTVVNNGTSTFITIDTDSLNQVIETVANELIEGLGIVMEELSNSMDVLNKELDRSFAEQNAIHSKERQLEKEEQNKTGEEQLAILKENIKAQKLALQDQQKKMQTQMQKAELEYRAQLKQMEQYKSLKDIYIDNREELDKVNGKVTIEIAKPVLKSSSITQKSNADTTDVKIVGKSVIKVIEGDNTSELAIGGYNNIYIAEKGNDTVEVRLGKKIMRVTDGGNGSNVTIDDVQVDFNDDNSKSKKHHNKFNSHWSTIELGMNTFTTPDYNPVYGSSGYGPNNDFMELNYNKSIEFNINPFHVDLPIINGRSQKSAKLGLVSGLGFNFNNYTFDNNITLAKNDGRLEPVDLEVLKGEGYKAEKSKLTTTYLTVPITIEFTLPGGDFYMSAGAIGAVKLGSHTKYKSDSNKDKGRGDFYLNPFRYGFTARVGYKSFSIYSAYYVSELFQDNKGPVATPFSIGIGLM